MICKVFWFIWKSGEGAIERQKLFSPICWFDLHIAVIAGVEARSHDLHSGFPKGWQWPEYLSILCGCPGYTLVANLIRSRGRTWTQVLWCEMWVIPNCDIIYCVTILLQSVLDTIIQRNTRRLSAKALQWVWHNEIKLLTLLGSKEQVH